MNRLFPSTHGPGLLKCRPFAMRISLQLHLFVFIGAFLLFTMEPLVARMVLPVHGGSFHVWTTTLTFFQGALFLGYVYCHLLARRLGGWHLLLVAAPLIWLPVANGIGLSAPGEGDPAWALLSQLTFHIALPFGVLATTSVIAQSWFTRSDTGAGSPYPLYASSNIGSLLGLLGYIIICEPLFGLKTQRIIWFVGYAGYVVLAWQCWRATHQKKTETAPDAPLTTDLKGSTVLYWLLLSAIPSAFMLAVSNVFTLELGSVPLVWVLPLVIYILTYVLTFSERQWIPARVLHALWPAAAVLGVCSFYFATGGSLWVFAVHALGLFILAMVGHGELYRLRPAPGQLTIFYLAIALGGWLGSMSVSLVAPILFNSLSEYPLILGLFALVLLILRKGDLPGAFRQHPAWCAVAVCLTAIPPFVITPEEPVAGREVLYQHRNYYGIYRVVNHPLSATDHADLTADERRLLGKRDLEHGSTVHGTQVLYPSMKNEPTTYYHRSGPLGDLLDNPATPRDAAIIGLGVGTCATYFRDGETVTFYELDPAIVNIAQQLFTYLEDCPATKHHVTGDARLQMAKAPDNSYDVILVDAFSSDAIPTHLLTHEALALYERKLKPNGRLILHVSSRYYALLGVIKATCGQDWDVFCKRQGAAGLQPFQTPSTFCVLVRKGETAPVPRQEGWFSLAQHPEDGTPWTDDYINTLLPLYRMLKAAAK